MRSTYFFYLSNAWVKKQVSLSGGGGGGGGGQVHLKKIALRGWATGKYGYKGIGHTKVSGVYTKLHQTPPPPPTMQK